MIGINTKFENFEHKINTTFPTANRSEETTFDLPSHKINIVNHHHHSSSNNTIATTPYSLIMANNTLVVAAGEIEGYYGSTHDEDHAISLANPSRRPSWWKIKTVVVLGLVVGVMAAAVVVTRVPWFRSGLREASSGPAARTGPESVLLQHYPYVQITNKTPYDCTKGKVIYLGSGIFCSTDTYAGDPNFLAPGGTWSASSRGTCLVTSIHATLLLPDGKDPLWCQYGSTGTSFSEYSIIMKGEDACCVQSSNQSGVCA